MAMCLIRYLLADTEGGKEGKGCITLGNKHAKLHVSFSLDHFMLRARTPQKAEREKMCVHN